MNNLKISTHRKIRQQAQYKSILLEIRQLIKLKKSHPEIQDRIHEMFAKLKQTINRIL